MGNKVILPREGSFRRTLTRNRTAPALIQNPGSSSPQEHHSASMSAAAQHETPRQRAQTGQNRAHQIDDAEAAILSFYLASGGGKAGAEAIGKWFAGVPQWGASQLKSNLDQKLGIKLSDDDAVVLLERITDGGPVALTHLVRRIDILFVQMQLRSILETLQLHKMLAHHLPIVHGQEELTNLLQLSRDGVQGLVQSALPEIVTALHSKIQEIRDNLARANEQKPNTKFIGDSDEHNDAFEGEFANQQDFFSGLNKKIGLPDPQILRAIVNEHRKSANSHKSFTTKNYHLTTHPAAELEAVLCPKKDRRYPGAGPEEGQRRILPLRIFLSAAGCLDSEAMKPYQQVLCDLEGECGTLALTAEDLVHEALVLLVVEGTLSPRAVQAVYAKIEKPPDMIASWNIERLFDTLRQTVGWDVQQCQEVVAKGRRMLRHAGLRPEEVLGIRLYTGPCFMLYNALMRNFPRDIVEGLEGNKFTSTIHCINSAILKLGKACPLHPRFVVRGTKNMKLPEKFAAKDELGNQGQIESGFLSTTTDRATALGYAAGGSFPIIMVIERGMVDRGATISWCSQYMSEEEVLFPPLSALEVTGVPSMTFTNVGPVLEVPIRITVNQHADTIDALVERRKLYHIGMLRNLTEEVDREARAIEGGSLMRVARGSFLEGKLVDCVRRARDHCRNELAAQDAVPPEDFNRDVEFKRFVVAGVEMRQRALELLDGFKHTLCQALIDASSSGNQPLVEVLVGFRDQGDLDVNGTDWNNMTALHHAAARRDGGILQALLGSGANTNALDLFGRTPLLFACSSWRSIPAAEAHEQERGSLEPTATVLMLVEAGASLRAKDYQGLNVLTAACGLGDLDLVQFLLEREPEMVSEVDGGSQTALMAAVCSPAQSKANIVRRLLAAGGDVTAADSLGRTAILQACSIRGTTADLVTLLVQAKANADAADRQGNTPLLAACQAGNHAVVRLLLESGADSSALRKDGYGAVALALGAGEVELAQMLFGSGRFGSEGQVGNGSLDVAAFARSTARAETLAGWLDGGASPRELAALLTAVSATVCDTEPGTREVLRDHRAFLSEHRELLEDPPLETRGAALLQLAGQDPEQTPWSQWARASAAKASTLQHLNKPAAPRSCRWRLTADCEVKCAVPSPDGALVAMADGGTLVLLDAALGVEMWRQVHMTAHQGGILSIAWHPNSASLVTVGSDKAIRVWDARAGTVILGPLRGHDLKPGCSCKLASRAEPASGVRQSPYTTAMGSQQARPPVVAPAVTGGQSGATTVDPSCLLQGHRDHILGVAWSPDGRLVATGGGRPATVGGNEDYAVRLWHAESGRLLSEPLKGHTAAVKAVAFHPHDSTLLASASCDRSVRFWDTGSGRERSVIRGHDGQEGCVCRFEGKQYNPECSVERHGGEVLCLAWSPSGSELATGSLDATLRLWDPASRTPRGVLRQGRSEEYVNSLSFCPRGTRLAAGSNNGMLFVFDVPSQTLIAQLPPQAHGQFRVWSVAFHPADADMLFSSSSDKSVRIWSVTNLSGSISSEPRKPHRRFSFSDDGRMLTATDDSGGSQTIQFPGGDHSSQATEDELYATAEQNLVLLHRRGTPKGEDEAEDTVVAFFKAETRVSAVQRRNSSLVAGLVDGGMSLLRYQLKPESQHPTS